MVHVSKFTSPMDPMGIGDFKTWLLHLYIYIRDFTPISGFLSVKYLSFLLNVFFYCCVRPYQQQADEMKDRPPEIELRQANNLLNVYCNLHPGPSWFLMQCFWSQSSCSDVIYIYIQEMVQSSPPYCWANSAPLVKLKCPSVTSYTYLVALGVPLAVNKSGFSMLNIGSSISDPVKAEHFGDELLQGVIKLHKLPILGESNNTNCYKSMVNMVI